MTYYILLGSRTVVSEEDCPPTLTLKFPWWQLSGYHFSYLHLYHSASLVLNRLKTTTMYLESIALDQIEVMIYNHGNYFGNLFLK